MKVELVRKKMYKPYVIGVDPGLKGGIAVIDQYMESSVALPIPLREWKRPLFDEKEAVDYSVKAKTLSLFSSKKFSKGTRTNIKHPLWGGTIVDVDAIKYAFTSQYEKNLFKGVQAFIEDPENIGAKKFTANLTVGNNIGLLNEAMRSVTGKDAFRVAPRQWQKHPAIQTWNEANWEHGAKDKSQAKKHSAIARANDLFSRSFSFSTVGEDGLTDALLIGLYGALLFPPVIKISSLAAWYFLNNERAGFIKLKTTLPFTETLIYAGRVDEKDYIEESVGLNAPPYASLLQDGIVGYLTLQPTSEACSYMITSRIAYPEPIKYDFPVDRDMVPYLDQLPHLIS